ncbi:hypothetical protein N5J23_06235 [Comamonas aquatica]|jgi:hypothetical protein|uniref:Uncharacterized protein n=1 Tax=Comamonas aquatica TaxID=225991 RepID=A0AA43AU88_9BURK|nr:hypothetical protein [Comamonas aquatica]MDH1618840.1 hypothetical protein [Comamonas aquatica]MDH2005143.1 hypothetical protein [Comamonas aquatica]
MGVVDQIFYKVRCSCGLTAEGRLLDKGSGKEPKSFWTTRGFEPHFKVRLGTAEFPEVPTIEATCNQCGQLAPVQEK